MIIGITGLPGVGKTTVSNRICDVFSSSDDNLDILHIDADEIVNKLYEPGESCYEKIKTFLGNEYLKKGLIIDKNKLRRTIFLNEKKLRIVNKLLHPSIWAEIRNVIDKNKDKDIIVVDAAYLEGIRDFLNYIVEVKADRKAAIRHSSSKKITEEMYKIIEKVNKPEIKSDFVINNDGDLRRLENQVQKLVESIKMWLK